MGRKRKCYFLPQHLPKGVERTYFSSSLILPSTHPSFIYSTVFPPSLIHTLPLPLLAGSVSIRALASHLYQTKYAFNNLLLLTLAGSILTMRSHALPPRSNEKFFIYYWPEVCSKLKCEALPELERASMCPTESTTRISFICSI